MPIGLGLLVLQYVAELICARHRPRAAVRHPRRRMPRTWLAPAPAKPWAAVHEPDHPRRDRPRRHPADAASGIPVAFGLGAIAIVFLADLPGLRQPARGRRDVLVRPRRVHAGVDPDVRDDGRGDRLLAGRQGPLRGARPLALPPARRTGDLQPRRLRDLRRAHRLVARLLRRHRQDGHPGDAPARLSGRHRHRLDLRRRHARHPDPAVDHLHPLRHRHRDLDRPAVHRRRHAGADADRPVHALDGLHHLEARLPRRMPPTSATRGRRSSSRSRRSRRSSSSSSA